MPAGRAGLRELAGPVLGGAAVGIILFLTALLVVEPPDKEMASLTQWGASLFFPERDVAIYLAGTLVTLILIVGLARLVSRRLSGSSLSPRAWGWVACYQLVAVAAAAGAFLAQFFQARVDVEAGSGIPASYFVTVGLSVTVILAASLWAERVPRPTPQDSFTGETPRWRPPQLGSRSLSGVDLGVIALLGAVVYVYGWRELAGEFYIQEGLIHWDYFALGPALSFSRGQALGSEVYSAYGVGWPMLFGVLDPWLPVSPGRMLQIGSIYGCLYFAGFYLTLRLLVGRRSWAVLGTAMAVTTMFIGLGEYVVWRFPSLTFMRWPMDVWCFIAVIMHLKTRRRLWAVMSGIACGLAVIFVTDTGLYLGAAFAFYWLTAFSLHDDKPHHLADLIAAGLATVSVILVGLGVAARGDLLTSEFWLGWLETVLEFAGGIGMLPLATLPEAPTVLLFLFAFFFYLVTSGHTLVRVTAGSARSIDVFTGFVAVYGIFMLLHFVGRSGDGTPARLILPLLILITLFAWQLNETWRRDELRIIGSPGFSYALMALLLTALVSAPGPMFTRPYSLYPNVVNTLGEDNRGDDPCLVREPKDICGIPQDLSGSVELFHDLSDRLQQLEQNGASFAVIDETGSLFYLETESPPWGRYSLLFASMHTNEQLETLVRRLAQDPPDYVLTRAEQGLETEIFEDWPVPAFGFGPRQDSLFYDTWQRLMAVIQEDYRLAETAGPFEIWTIDGSQDLDGSPAE